MLGSLAGESVADSTTAVKRERNRTADFMEGFRL